MGMFWGQKFYTHKDDLVQMKYKIWPDHSMAWKRPDFIIVFRFGRNDLSFRIPTPQDNSINKIY